MRPAGRPASPPSLLQRSRGRRQTAQSTPCIVCLDRMYSAVMMNDESPDLSWKGDSCGVRDGDFGERAAQSERPEESLKAVNEGAMEQG